MWEQTGLSRHICLQVSNVATFWPPDSGHVERDLFQVNPVAVSKYYLESACETIFMNKQFCSYLWIALAVSKTELLETAPFPVPVTVPGTSFLEKPVAKWSSKKFAKFFWTFWPSGLILYFRYEAGQVAVECNGRLSRTLSRAIIIIASPLRTSNNNS